MSRARDFANLAGSADAGGITGRNVIPNGAMQVSQRGDTTGITGADSFGGADRISSNGGGFGTASFSQQSDAPAGFANSHRTKITTARSTSATSDHFVISTRLEGQDLQRFKKGTSDAETMTLSFYAKASQATTITVELSDADNSRVAAKDFNITTSWARYSYTYPADTTGAFDDDNALSLYVFFWLAAGTDFTSGTDPDGTWISSTGNTSRRVHAAVGTTFADTLNAEFYLTGLQLEVGTLTDFEHRSYGDELARCQRYYFRINEGVNYQRFALGSCANSNNAQTTITLPVTMRTTPSVDTTGTAGDYAFFEAGIVHTLTSLPSINTSGSNAESVNVTCTSTGNFAAGNAGEFLSNNDTSVFFALSAEL